MTHILQLADTQAHPGSIGRLVPNVEARLVDPVGNDVERDPSGWAEGEMWVRGPNVMRFVRFVHFFAKESVIEHDGAGVTEGIWITNRLRTKRSIRTVG